MTSNLNSILLEGNITEYPTEQGDNLVTTITTTRYTKTETGITPHDTSIKVYIPAGNLAQSVQAQGTVGRGIRVVGRIAELEPEDDPEFPLNRIIVVAEHLEFKPLKFAMAERQVELF
jgi:single-strand DNA-binding protein